MWGGELWGGELWGGELWLASLTVGLSVRVFEAASEAGGGDLHGCS